MISFFTLPFVMPSCAPTTDKMEMGTHRSHIGMGFSGFSLAPVEALLNSQLSAKTPEPYWMSMDQPNYF